MPVIGQGLKSRYNMFKRTKQSKFNKWLVLHSPMSIGLHANPTLHYGFHKGNGNFPWLVRYDFEFGYIRLSIEWRNWGKAHA